MILSRVQSTIGMKDGLHVEVVTATMISPEVRQAWLQLRQSNPELWSPHFDLRLFDVLAQYAPHPKLAIVRKGADIVALLPFQGKIGSLARPLGAPLSDQHALIQGAITNIDLIDVLRAINVTGFVFTGLRQQVPCAVKLEESVCHVADLSAGLESYLTWRKANWNDQVKKNERRKRQGERQWGPMRIETACPRTSDHFGTLMAWKQAKYIETNRHNVLGVPWINAFLRHLYQSPDADFGGQITVLFFGEHLAALEFGLIAGDAMHSWFPAFDRTYAQVSPGILLMDGMIEHCGVQGITKIDLGIGHDQYKRHASNAPISVWSGSLPLTPFRRKTTQTFAALDMWLEQNLPDKLGQILGKLERRSEMILAAEPTFSGRLRGFVTALKALN